MIRWAAIVSCALLFGCGGPSYKIAPSTTRVTTPIATAKRSTQEAQERSAAIEQQTQRTHAAAETVGGNIDAALAALAAKDYIGAGKHLADAKAGNAVITAFLNQTLDDLRRMRIRFDQVATDLDTTANEFERYKGSVEKIVTEGAKNQAIVDEVNWGFGLGAFLYGIKRILTFGFFGVLGLAVAAVAMLAIGGPLAIWAMRGIKWILRLFKK